MSNFIVASFYKFVAVPFPSQTKNELELFWGDMADLKGSVLLAAEGINGSVAGSKSSVESFLAFTVQILGCESLNIIINNNDHIPFLRKKIKLKKEIVTLGIDDIDPNICCGTYVDPTEWNALISSSNVLVIDTRNEYEYSIGHFKNAINPHTQHFRQLPHFVEQLADYKNYAIAMYCTGGIRCEKSTSYLLKCGFSNVYHLKGGILKYLETVPATDSLWQGECFVFDSRVAVGHDLLPGRYQQCFNCRSAVTLEDRQLNSYKLGVSCKYCINVTSLAKSQASAERQRQIDLAAARNINHFS